MKKWNPWSTETHYSDWYRIDKICNYTKSEILGYHWNCTIIQKSGTLGQVKHLLRLVSDRRTYAIIQSETLGHIEIITRTYTYLCNTTKLSIFLTNHSSRLFLVISFELLWIGNRTKVRMEKGLNEYKNIP